MSVFVANEQSAFPVDELALASLARLVMEGEGVLASEVSILVVDEGVMQGLNQRFMGEDRPTDVLAFPIDGPEPASGPPEGPVGPSRYGQEAPGDGGEEEDDDDDDDEDFEDDEPWLLGDVVLCPATAAQADQELHLELQMLTVHGILHLCGFDHAEPDEEKAMFARTSELLAIWRAREDAEESSPE